MLGKSQKKIVKINYREMDALSDIFENEISKI